MANRRRFNTEGEKGLCPKEWGAKNGNNIATSWYTGSRIWRKIEDNGTSNKKLLVAEYDKKCGEICKRVRYMSENEE